MPGRRRRCCCRPGRSRTDPSIPSARRSRAEAAALVRPASPCGHRVRRPARGGVRGHWSGRIPSPWAARGCWPGGLSSPPECPAALLEAVQAAEDSGNTRGAGRSWGGQARAAWCWSWTGCGYKGGGAAAVARLRGPGPWYRPAHRGQRGVRALAVVEQLGHPRPRPCTPASTPTARRYGRPAAARPTRYPIPAFMPTTGSTTRPRWLRRTSAWRQVPAPTPPISAADVTLVNGDPGSIADAIQLSRATMTVIRANLGWACGYNVIAIPLAALQATSTRCSLQHPRCPPARSSIVANSCGCAGSLRGHASHPFPVARGAPMAPAEQPVIAAGAPAPGRATSKQPWLEGRLAELARSFGRAGRLRPRC